MSRLNCNWFRPPESNIRIPNLIFNGHLSVGTWNLRPLGKDAAIILLNGTKAIWTKMMVPNVHPDLLPSWISPKRNSVGMSRHVVPPVWSLGVLEVGLKGKPTGKTYFAPTPSTQKDICPSLLLAKINLANSQNSSKTRSNCFHAFHGFQGFSQARVKTFVSASLVF